MNTRRVNAAAGVILAAQKQKNTAAGIAMALEAAGLLQSPETAAELEQLRTDAARYRIAWRRARTRALSTGSAADRYAARARELQEALQESVITTLTIQTERDALRARVAELEAGSAVRGKCGRALATGEPCPVHDRPLPSADEQAPALGGLFERLGRPLEDPHDSPLHHTYAVPRDLPEVCSCGHTALAHRPGGCIADAFRSGLLVLCGCTAEVTA